MAKLRRKKVRLKLEDILKRCYVCRIIITDKYHKDYTPSFEIKGHLFCEDCCPANTDELPDWQLDIIKKRERNATSGPWQWAQDRLNDPIAPKGKDGKRHASKGERLAHTFIFCLKRLFLGQDQYSQYQNADPWEGSLAYLRWESIKGTSLANCVPGDDDCAFIAHARTDVPALIAEVERLRVRITELERQPKPTIIHTHSNGLVVHRLD